MLEDIFIPGQKENSKTHTWPMLPNKNDLCQKFLQNFYILFPFKEILLIDYTKGNISCGMNNGSGLATSSVY